MYFFIAINNKYIDTDNIFRGTKKIQQFYETDIDENIRMYKTFIKNKT